MAIKIAFWNLQRFNGASGEDSSRIEPMKKWLRNVNPDIFAACEIGDDGISAFVNDCGFVSSGSYDAGLGKDGKGTQLMLAVLHSSSYEDLAARGVASGGGTSGRGKVSIEFGPAKNKKTLMLVHQAAGNNFDNFSSAVELLKSSGTFVVGDMNWDYSAETAAKYIDEEDPNVRVVLPVGADNKTLGGTYRQNRTGNLKFFDYLLYKDACNVVGAPNNDPKVDAWSAYNYSDHAPIVYSIDL